MLDDASAEIDQPWHFGRREPKLQPHATVRVLARTDLPVLTDVRQEFAVCRVGIHDDSDVSLLYPLNDPLPQLVQSACGSSGYFDRVLTPSPKQVDVGGIGYRVDLVEDENRGRLLAAEFRENGLNGPDLARGVVRCGVDHVQE